MAVVMIIVLFPSAMGDEKVLGAEYRTEADGMSCQVVQDGYEASFYINGTWQTGYNVSAVIRNTTAENIDNWTVSLAFEGKIVNIWDAVIVDYEESLNTYIISNAGYNEDIAPYSCVQFGFTADAVDKESGCYPLPTDCKMLQKEENLINGTFSVRWHFSDAYNGTVYIKNESEQDICDWALGFDTDLKIYSFYTAETLEEKAAEGTHYVIKNRGYNSDIKAGEELSLGFSCSYVGEETMTNEALFRNFVLSDVRNGVMQPVVTPEPTEEPTATPEPTAVVTPEPTEEPTATPKPTAVVTPEPTEEPTATPEPTAVVTPEPTGMPEEEEYKDSDGDGLPDSYEEELGTDVFDIDTDHDGISDLLEFMNDLDPLTADGPFETDNDADSDGLTDSEELYIHLTDPLCPDSDNDRLSDGFEIRMGFDPLKADSNGDGIPDGEERIRQEVAVRTSDMPLDYHINGLKPGEIRTILGEERIIPDNILAVNEVSVEMETKGELEKQVTIDNIYGTHVYFTDVAARVGFPVDISCDADFDTAVIKFSYDESELGETDEKNLAIAWFSDEKNCFEIVDNSVVDTENNTVSCVTTHFSKYSIFDTEIWARKTKEAYDKAFNDFRVLDGNQSIAVVLDTGMRFFKEHSDIVKSELRSFGEAKKDDDSISMDEVHDVVDDISSTDGSLTIGEDGKIYTRVAENGTLTSDLMVHRASMEEFTARGTAAQSDDELTFLTDYYASQKTKRATYVIWITGSVLDTEKNSRAENALKKIKGNDIVLYQLGISNLKTSEKNTIANNIESTGGEYIDIFGKTSDIDMRMDEIREKIEEKAEKDGHSNYDVVFLVNVGEPILTNKGTFANIKDGIWNGMKSFASGTRIGLVKVHRDLNRTVEMGEGVTLSNRSSTGHFRLPSDNLSFFYEDVNELEVNTFPVENQSLAACFFPKYGFNPNDNGTRSVLYITGTAILDKEDIKEQIDSKIPLYVIYTGESLTDEEREEMDGVVRQTGGRAEYLYDTTKYRNKSVEVNFRDAMTCMKMACLGVEKMGHDSCIDADFDGIPDAVELNGMLLPNLNFVYTDPHSGDTDGDGLDDGKEIGYTEITYDYWKNIPEFPIPKGEDGNVKIAFCLSAKSNPTTADSDGDGYKDNGRNNDGQFADPRPLVSDVHEYKINNSDRFVPVVEYNAQDGTNEILYGGNQGWFREESSVFNDNLANHGCGLVACEDLLLYLAMENKEYLTEDIKSNFIDIDNPDEKSRVVLKSEFKKWGRYIAAPGSMEDELFYVKRTGLWSPELVYGLNKYFKKNSIELTSKSIYVNTFLEYKFESVDDSTHKARMINKIKRMLGKNLPVIFTIGFGDIVLYYSNPKKNYDTSLIDMYQFDKYGETSTHNLTITELISDKVAKRNWVVVQSWGEKYVTDLDFWLNNNQGLWDALVYLE